MGNNRIGQAEAQRDFLPGIHARKPGAVLDLVSLHRIGELPVKWLARIRQSCLASVNNRRFDKVRRHNGRAVCTRSEPAQPPNFATPYHFAVLPAQIASPGPPRAHYCTVGTRRTADLSCSEGSDSSQESAVASALARALP